MCRSAGGDRFGIYDVENHEGTPVYVHSKVVVADDVWAMIGSDNLNRRSWTHDSELSCAVVDAETMAARPADPAGEGDGARSFARNLRLKLLSEHLDRDAADLADLMHPEQAVAAFRRQAEQLAAWHDGGQSGPRPPGRVVPHRGYAPSSTQRLWATPLQRIVYDPDGRPWRDRARGRLVATVRTPAPAPGAWRRPPSRPLPGRPGLVAVTPGGAEDAVAGQRRDAGELVGAGRVHHAGVVIGVVAGDRAGLAAGGLGSAGQPPAGVIGQRRDADRERGPLRDPLRAGVQAGGQRAGRLLRRNCRQGASRRSAPACRRCRCATRSR